MPLNRAIPGESSGPSRRAGAVIPLLVAGAAMLVAACGGDGGPSPVAETAQRVDTLAQALRVPLDTTVLVVGGIAAGDDGRVYVADRERGRVQVFDARGVALFALGAGLDSALVRPCCPAYDRGTLWVRDAGNRRYVGWRIAGDTAEVVALLPLAHPDAASRAPIAFDEWGRLVDSGLQRDSAGQRRRHHFHLSPEGRVERALPLPVASLESTGMRTVRRRDGDRNMVYYVVSPYGPVELIADGPGGSFAYALSSEYEIGWHDAQGQLLHVLRGDTAAGPPLGEVERAAAQAHVDQISEQVGVAAADLGFAVPALKQPLRDMWFDGDGLLWVELSMPEGGLRRAHVYDADGTRVRDVAWPEDVDLRDGAIVGAAPGGAPLAVWGHAADSTGAALVRLVEGG